MGIGLLELVIIAVAALVLLGPEQLPTVLKQLGRLYVQLRRTSNEVRGVFDDMVREAEKEMRLEELKKIRALAEEHIAKVQQAPSITGDIAGTTPHAPSTTPIPEIHPSTPEQTAASHSVSPRASQENSPWKEFGHAHPEAASPNPHPPADAIVPAPVASEQKP